MCEAVGHPVRPLVRTRIGPLHDRRLAAGRVARADGRARCARLYEAAAAATPPNGRTGRRGEDAPG